VQNQEPTAVGVVGLGAMGGRIAARLLALGHEVHGYNRTRAKAEPLIDDGLVWAESPRAVAEATQVVISMVTDTEALESVTGGPEGILAGLGPDKVYVDMSTVGPDASRRLAEGVRETGASMLAAPVSGSLPAVEEGSLAIIVGGDAEAFTRVEPILRELGSTVTLVGDNAQALTLKLAINISLAVQVLAFSEGVLLAERSGVERRVALDVLTSSAIGSAALKARAPFLLNLPESAWFDVALMQKDLRLALESGADQGVPLPSTGVANALLDVARKDGLEHRDIAALFQVLSNLSLRGLVS
jgi:3-hydroxyisobutyrate dehydrogenase-like beta-hydroxyacid dehydrogenase